MTDKDQQERLSNAYERMLSRANDAWRTAEDATLVSIKKAIDEAADIAVDLGEVTRDEASLLAAYLLRDVRDATREVSETGQQLGEWIRLKLSLGEQWLADLLAGLADQTELAWFQFDEQLRHLGDLRQGQITGPGTLVCRGCAERVKLERAGPVPVCPNCGGQEFKRVYSGR